MTVSKKISKTLVSAAENIIVFEKEISQYEKRVLGLIARTLDIIEKGTSSYLYVKNDMFIFNFYGDVFELNIHPMDGFYSFVENNKLPIQNYSDIDNDDDANNFIYAYDRYVNEYMSYSSSLNEIEWCLDRLFHQYEEEQNKKKAREIALAKLTPEEKKLLGL